MAELEIVEKIIEVDKSGRVVIPKEIRQALQMKDVQPLLVELRKGEIILKPLDLKSDPLKAIAEMNLPIAEWEEIEKQIEERTSQD